METKQTISCQDPGMEPVFYVRKKTASRQSFGYFVVGNAFASAIWLATAWEEWLTTPMKFWLSGVTLFVTLGVGLYLARSD